MILGTVENARKLLALQVKRAVSRLPRSSLPGGANLRGVYTAVLSEMSKDRFVPLPFGIWEEREEYAEALYDFSLQELRETIAFTATKEELTLKAGEILEGMKSEASRVCSFCTLQCLPYPVSSSSCLYIGVLWHCVGYIAVYSLLAPCLCSSLLSPGASMSISALRELIPQSLLPPHRFASSDEAGNAIIDQVLGDALIKTEKPKSQYPLRRQFQLLCAAHLD